MNMTILIVPLSDVIVLNSINNTNLIKYNKNTLFFIKTFQPHSVKNWQRSSVRHWSWCHDRLRPESAAAFEILSGFLSFWTPLVLDTTAFSQWIIIIFQKSISCIFLLANSSLGWERHGKKFPFALNASNRSVSGPYQQFLREYQH